MEIEFCDYVTFVFFAFNYFIYNHGYIAVLVSILLWSLLAPGGCGERVGWIVTDIRTTVLLLVRIQTHSIYTVLKGYDV